MTSSNSVVLDGRFTIQVAIAQGGFGAVFRALDHENDELVAIKTMLPELFGVEEDLLRFEREAQVGFRLHHPNTARLRHFGGGQRGNAEQPPFMVFDLVRGLPLGAIVEQRRVLPPDEACHAVISILESLQEAHDQGIIHRDIKPNNVMVEAPEAARMEPAGSGTVAEKLGVPPVWEAVWGNLAPLTVKVMDFGFAKLRKLDDRTMTTITKEGTTSGTIPFMSPEHIDCRPDIDHRSDVYSCGMLLYHLLSGTPPFLHEDIVDIVRGHYEEPPPPLPGELKRHPITEVFRKSAAKAPSDRYQSASEMAEALRDVRRAGPVKRGFFRRLMGR